MKKYIIGMDGGGTKTRIRVATLTGEPIDFMDVGPSNIHAVSLDEVYSTLNIGLTQILEKNGLEKEGCVHLCMGAAGVGREKDRAKMLDILNRLAFQNITLLSDAQTCLMAEFKELSGIVLIAGTGSLCLGYNNGEMFRTGGWGHILGDEGSGYYIGKSALNLAMKHYDKRVHVPILANKVLSHLKVDNFDEIIYFTYAKTTAKQDIAEFSKVVHEASLEGCQASQSILLNASEALIEVVSNTIEHLKFEESINVVLNGSVIEKNALIYGHFEKVLKEKYPKIRLQKMTHDAATGAIEYVLKNQN